MALLAGERSQLLGVRDLGDPGMAGRALETPMDRCLENSLVREKRDRLARDLFLEVLVSMAAETFLPTGSLRRGH